MPLTGHVQPMAIVVRGLVARGHEVAWYGARKFAGTIAAAGARHLAMTPAIDWDDADVDAALPRLRGTRGLARVRAQLVEMFVAPAAQQLADLERAVADARAAGAPFDVVLADQAHLGAALLGERDPALPWAGLGISALVIPSADVAPYGPGWRPARGALGRLRVRLQRAIVHLMFRGVTRAWQAARVAAGLARDARTYFDVLAPSLFLQPTVAAFEYPRRDLPPQVRFIGPLLPAAAAVDPAKLPAWWPELLAARAANTPIVLVTQGTLATSPRELIEPALAALAGEPVFVVATSPRPLAPARVPANARAAPFVPYAALMPHLAAMVTNGGYGGVQMALGAGVPLVVAGGSEEKPEIAARVAWTGAGIDLRTGTPRVGAIRRAVRRVLADARYRAGARALADAMAATDAPATAAHLLEQLV